MITIHQEQQDFLIIFFKNYCTRRDDPDDSSRDAAEKIYLTICSHYSGFQEFGHKYH